MSNNFFGFGDYIGKISLEENKLNIPKHGSNLHKLLKSFENNPKLFIIWSIVALGLTIAWLKHPWPLPADTITKHPGALQIFVLIYITVSILYFFLFVTASTTTSDFIPDIYDTATVYQSGYAAKVYGSISSVIIIVLLIVGLFELTRRYNLVYSIVTNILNIIIVLLALTFIVLILKKIFPSNVNLSHIPSLIWKIIKFIPCLIISAFEWFLRQESGKKLDGSPDIFYARHKLVWIVLLVEVIIIALRFALPYIFNKLATHNGDHILQDPVYINKKHMIGKYEDLRSKDKKHYNYNYSLSAWIYINPQPPSTSVAYSKFTSLLDYGGKPKIEYNGIENVVRVTTKNKKNEIVTIASIKNIQFQKWNNFVINYDGANMDVFLNGELIGTKPNIAPYMSLDDVVAGEDNGIHGGICNVIYYNHTLSQSHIQLIYKTLRDKSIPNI